MNIAFINPPFHPKYSRGSRSPAVTKSGTVYYPIWLALAAGVAEKRGHSITLIDAPAEIISAEQVIERLHQFRPGLAVVETSTGSISSDIRFAEQLKQTFPSIFVCLVGNHATALHEEVLNQYPVADAVARNEYEETIVELAGVLSGGGALEKVTSLTWRDGGSVRSNPQRPANQKLDDMPFASEIFKRFCKPRDYFFAAGRYPQMMVYTGRGCPYLCTYCVYPQNFYGHTYIHRSPESIAAEFRYIEQNFPEVVEVTIEDDTFTVYKKHTIDVCKLLIAQKNTLTWTCNVRADLDEETMRWMKRANCRLVIVGFESGSNEILKLMKKGVSVEQFKAAENAKKTGLLIHACYMMGNRGETLETMYETLNLAKKLNTDTAQFFPLMIYPGTEAYEWAKKENLIDAKSFDEWLTPEGLHNTVVRTHDLTAQEIVDFCNYARREYYLRPAYMFMKLKSVLRNPAELRRTLKAFLSFYKYLFGGSHKENKNKFETKLAAGSVQRKNIDVPSFGVKHGQAAAPGRMPADVEAR
ncbi:MAG TPA: radical SAM protein [Bacteroidota bacterium]|nr:radical SAM protein [Bacteroidota bacterium]